ncbi:MAG TPA: hypothetical protein P5121_05205 [Caldilineaceae bacterium]|nr:hypothetical protein [Caldilineaceae bacterium]
MAKKTTKDKLAGWDAQLDTTANAPEVKDQKWKRKTYLLNEELIERHKKKADELGIQINELLRYIMEEGLNRLDSGEWKLDLEPTSYTIKR